MLIIAYVGHGKCGVAVIRVSGSMTSTIIEKMGRYSQTPKPRQALLRTLVDPKTQDKLDSALVLWFPAPHSFTGILVPSNLTCSFMNSFPLCPVFVVLLISYQVTV